MQTPAPRRLWRGSRPGRRSPPPSSWALQGGPGAGAGAGAGAGHRGWVTQSVSPKVAGAVWDGGGHGECSWRRRRQLPASKEPGSKRGPRQAQSMHERHSCGTRSPSVRCQKVCEGIGEWQAGGEVCLHTCLTLKLLHRLLQLHHVHAVLNGGGRQGRERREGWGGVRTRGR